MNINSLCKSRIHSYLYNGEIQFLVIKKYLCLAVIKKTVGKVVRSYRICLR